MERLGTGFLTDSLSQQNAHGQPQQPTLINKCSAQNAEYIYGSTNNIRRPAGLVQILNLSKFVLALLEIQVAQREEEIAVRCEWLKRAALGKKASSG